MCSGRLMSFFEFHEKGFLAVLLSILLFLLKLSVNVFFELNYS